MKKFRKHIMLVIGTATMLLLSITLVTTVYFSSVGASDTKVGSETTKVSKPTYPGSAKNPDAVDGSNPPDGDVCDPEDDNDGDETPNSEDPDFKENDIDNDGVQNDKDYDMDGDGKMHHEDDDIDGDGTINDEDVDDDGDGIADEADPRPHGPEPLMQEQSWWDWFWALLKIAQDEKGITPGEAVDGCKAGTEKIEKGIRERSEMMEDLIKGTEPE